MNQKKKQKNQSKFIYLTEMYSFDYTTNEFITYSGPNIEAYTFIEAEDICTRNYPYLKVIGKLNSIINIEEPIISNLNLN